MVRSSSASVPPATTLVATVGLAAEPFERMLMAPSAVVTLVNTMPSFVAASCSSMLMMPPTFVAVRDVTSISRSVAAPITPEPMAPAVALIVRMLAVTSTPKSPAASLTFPEEVRVTGSMPPFALILPTRKSPMLSSRISSSAIALTDVVAVSSSITISPMPSPLACRLITPPTISTISSLAVASIWPVLAALCPATMVTVPSVAVPSASIA